MSNIEIHHYQGPYDWRKDTEPLYQERFDPALKTRMGKLLGWMGFKSPNQH